MTDKPTAVETYKPWMPRLLDWVGLPEMFDEPRLKVEEFREDDFLVVRAEMPDIDPDEDVDIDVIDHTLRIRAERRHEEKVEEKDGFRTEFQYGSFTRVLPLPRAAAAEDVKATYHDGILEIRVPLDVHEADKRRIQVQRV